MSIKWRQSKSTNIRHENAQLNIQYLVKYDYISWKKCAVLHIPTSFILAPSQTYPPPPTHINTQTFPCKHIQRHTLSDSRNLGFHADILPNWRYGSDDVMGREHRTGSLADEESSWQLSICLAYPPLAQAVSSHPATVPQPHKAQCAFLSLVSSPKHFLKCNEDHLSSSRNS